MHTRGLHAGNRFQVPIAVLVGLALVASCGGDDDGDGDAESSATSESSAPAEPTAPPVPAATVAAAFDPLVGVGEVELVGDGFRGSEGPQWLADDGVLVFTDNTNIRAFDGDEIALFGVRSVGIGLAVDPQGLLIAADPQRRAVTRTEVDGTVTSLADEFEGVRLNQTNDVTARSDGTIYFTDPLYGNYAPDLDFRGVFRIAPDGGLTAERRGELTEQPNGVALSPDESLLYVSNWADDLVWVFDVAADGSLSEARTFVTTGGSPDGVTVDSGGNVFVATVDGIEVFAPDGAPWGVIPVPQQAANSAFGGADGRTLYITAQTGLYRVTLENPGPY